MLRRCCHSVPGPLCDFALCNVKEMWCGGPVAVTQTRPGAPVERANVAATSRGCCENVSRWSPCTSTGGVGRRRSDVAGSAGAVGRRFGRVTRRSPWRRTGGWSGCGWPGSSPGRGARRTRGSSPGSRPELRTAAAWRPPPRSGAPCSSGSSPRWRRRARRRPGTANGTKQLKREVQHETQSFTQLIPMQDLRFS